MALWTVSRTTRVSWYQKGKTRKVKPISNLLEQEIVSGIGISLAICKSASCPRQNSHASIPPLSFLQARCPSCHPTNSVKALKAEKGLLESTIYCYINFPDVSLCWIITHQLYLTSLIRFLTNCRL